MRFKFVLFAILCASAVAFAAAEASQDQDQDDVRGAFLTSRPKEKASASEGSSRPSRRRPRVSPASNSGKASEKKTSNSSPSIGGSAPVQKSSEPPRPVNAPRIGLGMTLFTRDSNGLAVRADPEHVFRKGDRVRLLLETNTDGYLYIFNQTNDGPVIMIYPDKDLDEAGNYIKAHVPWEIPSGAADEERLRWLVFDEYPGNERLFLVLTREPLKSVPIEDDLVSFCSSASGNCPWRPDTEVWELIQKQMQEPLTTDKSARYGKAQTAPEQQAATRGLGLAKDDPEPSLIMMASSKSPMLVATLDLVHK